MPNPCDLRFNFPNAGKCIPCNTVCFSGTTPTTMCKQLCPVYKIPTTTTTAMTTTTEAMTTMTTTLTRTLSTISSFTSTLFENIVTSESSAAGSGGLDTWLIVVIVCGCMVIIIAVGLYCARRNNLLCFRPNTTNAIQESMPQGPEPNDPIPARHELEGVPEDIEGIAVREEFKNGNAIRLSMNGNLDLDFDADVDVATTLLKNGNATEPLVNGKAALDVEMGLMNLR